MYYEYKHPELFEGWEKPEEEELKKNSVILYGAGRRGSVAAHCLKKRNIQFLCFCDSDEKKQGKEFYGKKVLSISELEEKYKESIIIITSNHYLYIYEDLKKRGFSKLYSSVFLFLKIDFDGYNDYSVEYQERNIEQYFYALAQNIDGYIPQIQVPITLRCTLRCKECNSYIPYQKEKPNDFEYEDIVQSLDKLLTSCDCLGSLLLYGGEPFLYERLADLLEYYCRNNKIEKVYVVTNGTIVPNMELCEKLSHEKVILRVSDYGSLSKRKEQIVELAKQYNIKLEITDFKVWNTNPTVANLQEDDEMLKRKVRNCCGIAKFLTVIDRKVFFCTYSAFFHYYKALPDFGDNYIDLSQFQGTAMELRKEIKNYQKMPDDGLPKMACRYCKFNNYEDDLPVAEQTKEILEFEKIYFGN